MNFKNIVLSAILTTSLGCTEKVGPNRDNNYDCNNDCNPLNVAGEIHEEIILEIAGEEVNAGDLAGEEGGTQIQAGEEVNAGDLAGEEGGTQIQAGEEVIAGDLAGVEGGTQIQAGEEVIAGDLAGEAGGTQIQAGEEVNAGDLAGEEGGTQIQAGEEVIAGDLAGEAGGEMIGADIDSDNDGVIDSEDLCDETIVSDLIRVDSRGCIDIEALNDELDQRCENSEEVCTVSCFDNVLNVTDLNFDNSQQVLVDGACMIVRNPGVYNGYIAVEGFNYIKDTYFNRMYISRQTINPDGIHSRRSQIYPMHFATNPNFFQKNISLQPGLHIFQARPNILESIGSFNGPFNDSLMTKIGLTEESFPIQPILDGKHSRLNLINAANDTVFIEKDQRLNTITISNFYPEDRSSTYTGVVNMVVSHSQRFNYNFRLTTTNSNGETSQDFTVSLNETVPIAINFDGPTTYKITYNNAIFRFNLNSEGTTFIDNGTLCDANINIRGSILITSCE